MYNIDQTIRKTIPGGLKGGLLKLWYSLVLIKILQIPPSIKGRNIVKPFFNILLYFILLIYEKIVSFMTNYFLKSE